MVLPTSFCGELVQVMSFLLNIPSVITPHRVASVFCNICILSPKYTLFHPFYTHKFPPKGGDNSVDVYIFLSHKVLSNSMVW